MLAVFKKDFRSSLNGMTGPIFIFAVLIIMGFFTYIYQFKSAYPNFEFSIVDGAFWSLLLAPILTMRSLTEERKAKTDQLLYSLPITTTQIVLGKFLALAAVFAIPCAVLCVYPLVINVYASEGINFAVAYGAILSYFLLGCAVIALCMLISSLFESQVICAILNLALLLALYFVKSTSNFIPEDPWLALAIFIILSILLAMVIYSVTKNYIATAVAGVLLVGAATVVYFTDSSLYTGLGKEMISAVFIFQPITSFANGVFDITCLIYYLSLCALFVFITVQSFEKRRWN